MGITPQQRITASAAQAQAAHDLSAQVRLIAGPGTGKSATIEERVRWLLARGVAPACIRVVSFTRASAQDLRARLNSPATVAAQPLMAQVNVTTLHSLALACLRAAGFLANNPTPMVLDTWETQEIHDAEFHSWTKKSLVPGIRNISLSRAREIRECFDAFMSTGIQNPPNYLPPVPAITQPEINEYHTFNGSRRGFYHYMLLGEIVGECVINMRQNLLDPAQLLGIEHLIVDEYQDLNPMDLAFVDGIIAGGVTTFVAGDDDQSIYSFRHASPSGIQQFHVRHPGATSHVLADCFRCTSDVLSAAMSLFPQFAGINRIPKTILSLYTASQPVEPGTVHRWRFSDCRTEARAIAESCRELNAAGVPFHQIMVLLGNARATLSVMEREFTAANIPFETPREPAYIDLDDGRFVLAALRIVCNPHDYVAHRVILGLMPGVGAGTCDNIARSALLAGLDFRSLFYSPLPGGVFNRSATTAIQKAAQIFAALTGWTPTDTLATRTAGLVNLVTPLFGLAAAGLLQAVLQMLPPDTFIKEALDYIWASNDGQRADILGKIYLRLNLQTPPAGFLPAAVRIMTMHNAKGLDAHVVFIPCLEDTVFPTTLAMGFQGKLLESARALFMSITRARAACILSFADNRMLYGLAHQMVRSQFAPFLGGAFGQRTVGLSNAEATAVATVVSHL